MRRGAREDSGANVIERGIGSVWERGQVMGRKAIGRGCQGPCGLDLRIPGNGKKWCELRASVLMEPIQLKSALLTLKNCSINPRNPGNLSSGSQIFG